MTLEVWCPKRTNSTLSGHFRIPSNMCVIGFRPISLWLGMGLLALHFARTILDGREAGIGSSRDGCCSLRQAKLVTVEASRKSASNSLENPYGIMGLKLDKEISRRFSGQRHFIFRREIDLVLGSPPLFSRNYHWRTSAESGFLSFEVRGPFKTTVASQPCALKVGFVGRFSDGTASESKTAAENADNKWSNVPDSPQRRGATLLLYSLMMKR